MDHFNFDKHLLMKHVILWGVVLFFTGVILRDIILSSKYQIAFIILPLLSIAIDIFTFANDHKNYINKPAKKKMIQYWLYSILIGILLTIFHVELESTKIVNNRIHLFLFESFLITILWTIRLWTFREIKFFMATGASLRQTVIILICICIFQLPSYILSFSLKLNDIYRIFISSNINILSLLFPLAILTSCLPAFAFSTVLFLPNILQRD